jgi:hypothetical protein
LNFLWNKSNLKVFAVYSGQISHLGLMQSELPGMNLGEFYCPDAQEVLANLNNYLLVFTDGEKYLQGPHTENKTQFPPQELQPITWRKKPEVSLELSAETITAGQEVTMTIVVVGGFDPAMCPVVELLFNGASQMFELDGTGQTVITLSPTEAMVIEIKPEPAFFRGNEVRLEVLPV